MTPKTCMLLGDVPGTRTRDRTIRPPGGGKPLIFPPCLPHIPVFSFNSPIVLLASVFPIPSVSTFSPASLAMAAIYPVCLPDAFSSPVVQLSGSCIGSSGFASWFFVSAFFSSSIFWEASLLLREEGSTSVAPF